MRKRRILSLLLAVAVMATMLVAVPLTASAATGDTGYAEWVIMGNNSIDDETTHNSYKSSSDLVISPTITNTSVTNAKFTPGEVQETTSFKAYSGEEKQIGTGEIKGSAKVGSSSAITINTDLNNSEKFNKYDLLIVYSERYKDSGIKVSGDASRVIGEQNGSGDKTQHYKTMTYEVKNLSDNNIKIQRGSNEADILYIGLNYGYEEKAYVPVTSVNIEQENATAYVDDSTQLTLNVTVEPGTATKKKINWTYQGEGEVTIDDAGVVTGKKAGTVTATATSDDNSEAHDSCVITVKEQPRVSGEDGGVEKLEVAENRVYDLQQAALDAEPVFGLGIYDNGKCYFNNQIAFLGTAKNAVYTKNKGCRSLSGKENTGYGSFCVSKGENVIAIKLPAKATVRLVLYAWGGTARKGYIASSLDDCGGSVLPDKHLASTEDISTNNTAYRELSYTNGDAEQVVYISGTGQLGIYDIEVTLDTENIFGEKAADSGKYTNKGEAERGVIRFLQQYVGEEQVTEYGFKILNSDAEIVDKGVVVSSTVDPEKVVGKGFYADVYGIERSGDGDTTYYAKAYVKIGNQTIWSDGTNSKSVSWDNEINYQEPTE